ncbi:MAG: carbohydrate binding domain-containing protein, partial [Planctomycetota bacterium]
SPGHAQVVNILDNGGFEDGVMAPWSIYAGPPGANGEVVTELVGAAVPEDPIEGDYCLHVMVPEAGENAWASGLQHAGHVFETNKIYTLSVFLKCNEGTLSIGLKPELGEDPWTGYGATTVTITDEWVEYTTTTPVITEDVDPATITFHISATAGDFWVDAVRWYEGDYVPPSFSSFTARNPSPENGATHPETWASLSWTAGNAAASHDVYIGDNYDDVLAGTGDTFWGNQGLDFIIAGFPGNPYPDGLVQGTTYYWRIDEVNDLHPDSPWVGDVWSFLVPPKKAYNPIPADGAKFLEADVELGWAAGFGTILHNVYLGDNFDDVDAGTGGTAQGPAALPTFSVGNLDPGKTYYWRIDEFDGFETHKGDIWSFATAGPGGGVRADYYKGMNFENLVLTRTDPQIDFSWGDPGGPDASVGDDNFSARWTGEVEAAFTETYTFYPRTDDGARLYVDGQLLVDRWVDRSATENRGTIDLIAGNTYSLVMEYYENTGGAVAELRWSSPRTPKQLIPQAALALPVKASSPTPRGGSVDVKQTTDLSWGPGDEATSHELYFGTHEEAVRNATTASPEFKGTIALGNETYDPGKLEWATTYYWRVDEINPANPDSPWTGNIWNFTTADFLIIDDMESYNATDNQIWFSWHDGLGAGAPGSPDYLPGNGTGSAVGDETTPSFTEETIVHGGSQSMPLFYDNNKQGYSNYSETELTLTDVRNWTEGDVAHLTLWFRGLPGSVGSFVEGPAGTFTMTGSGADIWAVNGVEADEFHFAYRMLNGAGSIVAKVESMDNTNNWAKAGVMIRETLDPSSAHAMTVVTPAEGVSFQRRPSTAGTSTQETTTGITAPHWVKIERTISGSFTASSSTNGTTWQPVGTPQNIQMSANVYIGLAVTAHDAALTCQAVLSNVQTSGNVTGQWTNQDVGIESNDAEPLYVAVSNSAGQPAVIVHDNPNASQLDSWTKWVISLQDLADQGVNLMNVDRIALGLGTRGNTTVPGGSGKMFFDDIRLERATEGGGVNLLTNGGFEDGIPDPWRIYDNTGSDSIMEVVGDDVVEGSSSLHIVVPTAGAVSWDVGLSQDGFVFEAGKNYTLSAFIKCKEGTLDVNFKPERAADPWEGYGSQVMTITDQWVEYSISTPVIAAEVDPATITFHIGFAPGEIWLDNVRFYEGDYVPPE